MRPSPPYLGLILAAIGKLEAFLAKGCLIRENKRSEDDSDDDDEALVNLVKTTFMQGLSSSSKSGKKETPSTSSVDSPRSGNASPNG